MATEPLRFLCCCAPPYTHEDTYLSNRVTGCAMVSADSSPLNCDWKDQPLLHPRYGGDVTSGAWTANEFQWSRGDRDGLRRVIWEANEFQMSGNKCRPTFSEFRRCAALPIDEQPACLDFVTYLKQF